MKPEVFFHGQYASRSHSGIMAVVSGLLPSTIIIAVAAYVLSMDADRLTIVVVAIFAVVALLFGGASLWALWGWVCDRCIQIEINEDGIVYGNRFWPWDSVRSFAGTRYANGVCLGFTPRWRAVWGGGGLDTTPLLTDEQYTELAQDVSQGIAARFPHVVVAMHPLRAAAEN